MKENWEDPREVLSGLSPSPISGSHLWLLLELKLRASIVIAPQPAHTSSLR